jgi:hypothetical protein
MEAGSIPCNCDSRLILAARDPLRIFRRALRLGYDRRGKGMSLYFLQKI